MGYRDLIETLVFFAVGSAILWGWVSLANQTNGQVFLGLLWIVGWIFTTGWFIRDLARERGMVVMPPLFLLATLFAMFFSWVPRLAVKLLYEAASSHPVDRS